MYILSLFFFVSTLKFNVLLFSCYLFKGGYVYSPCPHCACKHNHPFLLAPNMDYISTCRHIQLNGNCSTYRAEHVTRNNSTARSSSGEVHQWRIRSAHRTTKSLKTTVRDLKKNVRVIDVKKKRV